MMIVAAILVLEEIVPLILDKGKALLLDRSVIAVLRLAGRHLLVCLQHFVQIRFDNMIVTALEPTTVL